MGTRFITILLFLSSCTFKTKAQTVTDTIGNTFVEISVAVDTSNYTFD